MIYHFGYNCYEFKDNADIFKAEELYTADISTKEFERKMLLNSIQFKRKDRNRVGCYIITSHDNY